MIDDAMIGRVALLTQELLIRPDRDELVAELRARVPVGLLDQHDAAARDLHAGLDRIMAASGGDLREGEGADLPGGLLLGLCTTVVGWRAGRGRTCEHAIDPRAAQPVVVAAWRPDLVVCGLCVHLLALPHGSEPDRTCDACGRVCAGAEHDDGVYPGMVVAGSVTFLIGLCSDCQHQHQTRERAA